MPPWSPERARSWYSSWRKVWAVGEAGEETGKEKQLWWGLIKSAYINLLRLKLGTKCVENVPMVADNFQTWVRSYFTMRSEIHQELEKSISQCFLLLGGYHRLLVQSHLGVTRLSSAESNAPWSKMIQSSLSRGSLGKRKQWEVCVKLEEAGKIWRGVALEASQGPGGNTDNYTGAKFKMYTSLIDDGSYHLKNPPCIRLSTWNMWMFKVSIHIDITITEIVPDRVLMQCYNDNMPW